jgi:S1-C subfamily serine protease
MLQVTIAELAARVGPSVAGVGRGWGRGSGVVFARDRVITNAHVLRGPDVALTLGATVVHGRVAGVDRRRDLAVIAADTGDAAPVPPAPERPPLGALVFALADPGGRGLRVTHGHVAADFRRVIEHTAPLPRGASGGPLVDEQGRLLGLNTARLEGGFILAAPFDLPRAEALARGETVPRPELGVALGRGLIVRAVKDAGPAAVAGIRPGDRCVAVDDEPLRSVDDLLDAVEAGRPFTLTVLREGEQRDFGLQL